MTQEKPYKPDGAEIHKAQVSMTPEQKKLSDQRYHTARVEGLGELANMNLYNDERFKMLEDSGRGNGRDNSTLPTSLKEVLKGVNISKLAHGEYDYDGRVVHESFKIDGHTLYHVYAPGGGINRYTLDEKSMGVHYSCAMENLCDDIRDVLNNRDNPEFIKMRLGIKTPDDESASDKK